MIEIKPAGGSSNPVNEAIMKTEIENGLSELRNLTPNNEEAGESVAEEAQERAQE
jgi:hypothetical protein